jgi:heat-inducible transcriptional repressor
VSLVRVTRERLLVVLVAQSGQAHRRVIEDRGSGDQAELERIAALLNERIAGRTLSAVRRTLEAEARELRDAAGRLLQRALEIGARALAGGEPRDGFGDLVIATRLALLDQPEFRDPERLRELFAALETREQLVLLIDRVLRSDAVSVAFGNEVAEPALRGCALVVAPYGRRARPLGALGVIGPSRMDFARIVPLVGYLSQLVTEKLRA